MTSRRACDYCRYRRVKCEFRGNETSKCIHCAEFLRDCTFGSTWLPKPTRKRRTSLRKSGTQAHTELVRIDHPVTHLNDQVLHFVPFASDSQRRNVSDSIFDLCMRLTDTKTDTSLCSVLSHILAQELPVTGLNHFNAPAALLVALKGQHPDLTEMIIAKSMDVVLSTPGPTGERILACVIIVDTWTCLVGGKLPSIPINTKASFENGTQDQLLYHYMLADLLRQYLAFDENTSILDRLRWEYEFLLFPVRLPQSFIFISHTRSTDESAFLNVVFSVAFQLYYTSGLEQPDLGLGPLDGLLMICAHSAEGICIDIFDRMQSLVSWTIGQMALRLSVNNMVKCTERHRSADAVNALKTFLARSVDLDASTHSNELAELRRLAQIWQWPVSPKVVDETSMFWVFRDTRIMTLTALIKALTFHNKG